MIDLLRGARRPVIMAGTGLYWAHGEDALRALAEEAGVPAFVNGLGRGCLPADHELFFSRARGKGLKEADVALVVAVPMDFRLGFGQSFGEDTEIVLLDSARTDHRPPRDVADGAFGFSGMEFDTLVRHDVPVVAVMGNNGIWGLEKHPMESLYGYSVAADLQPECRYDQVVEALGGHGELVREPGELRGRWTGHSPAASRRWSTC